MRLIFSIPVFLFLSIIILTSCKRGLDWEVQFSNTGTYASPRAIDLNGDQVLDLVIGAGGLEEWDSSENGVLAIDGRNGKLLWNRTCRNQVVGSPVFLDINQDDTPDIIIGGRSAQLMALDGNSGALIWEYYPDDGETYYQNDTAILNFFNPQIIPDLDGDNKQEILIAYGGFVQAKPADTDRPAGYLMLLSSQNGNVIAKAPMPDGKETYLSPVVAEQNGTLMVYFGSGGETIAGNFYLTDLNDLLDNRIDNYLVLAEGTEKGFIAPPILADLNQDRVMDVVVNAYEGKTMAFDGASHHLLWEVIPGDLYETHAQPAVGRFVGEDTVPDFFVNYGKGQWPEITASLQVVIDGATGEFFPLDSLGILQYSSPIVLTDNNTNSDLVFFPINQKQATTFSLESGKPQFSYTNSLYIFNLGTRKSEDLFSFEGTNVGSTLLASDLNGDEQLELIYLHNQNPYDPFRFTGLKIKCVTIPGYTSSWNQYMGPLGRSTYEKAGTNSL